MLSVSSNYTEFGVFNIGIYLELFPFKGIFSILKQVPLFGSSFQPDFSRNKRSLCCVLTVAIQGFGFGPSSGNPTFLVWTLAEVENGHPSMFNRTFSWLKSVYAQMHEETVLSLVQVFPLKCVVQICHDHPIPHSFKTHLCRKSRYKELRNWGLCLNRKRKLYRGCLCNLSRVVYHVPRWDVTIQLN